MQAVFAPLVKGRVALARLPSLALDVADNIREVKLQDIGDEISSVMEPCRRKLRKQRWRRCPPMSAMV